jgi:AcrR family transcriptional regulator
MAEKGYARTSVADVLKRAGVSRRAFYELFDDKLDCFLAAFHYAGRILQQRILEAGGLESISRLDTASEPMALFEIAITAYLNALADELPIAKLFLIESYAGGLKAIRRRAEIQQSIADMLAVLMKVTGPRGADTCTMFIAAVSSRVTEPVAADDQDAIRALAPEFVAHVRGLWDMGAFSEPGESLGSPSSAQAHSNDIAMPSNDSSRLRADVRCCQTAGNQPMTGPAGDMAVTDAGGIQEVGSYQPVNRSPAG